MAEQSAKQISRLAGRRFEATLPEDWIYRSQEDQEDVGIDGEIELEADDGTGSGFIFKVQIKGVAEAALIDEGRVLPFSLKLERLKYYMNNLEVPVILIVVDLATDSIYWLSLQDNSALRESLTMATAKGQDSLTVHVPVNQLYEGNWSDMLSAVGQAMNWLRLHAVQRMTAGVQETINATPLESIEDLLKKHSQVVSLLRSQKFDNLFRTGNYEELWSEALAVLRSDSEEVGARFSAGLHLERVLQVNFRPESEAFIERAIPLYEELRKLARPRDVDRHFKMMSVVLYRALQLQLALGQHFHARISDQLAASDPLASLVSLSVRFQADNTVAKLIYKTNILAHRLLRSGLVQLLAEFIKRVTPSLIMHLREQEAQGNAEYASALSEWIEYLVGVLEKWARHTGEDADLAASAVRVAALGTASTIEDAIARAKEIASKIVDQEFAKQVFATIQKFRDAADSSEDMTPDPEEELEFFRERAVSMGFQVDNPQDDLSRVIAIGLRDFNPERVMRDCRHLMVLPSQSLGIPAKMVGLQFAGMKTIRCMLHGYATSGWSLDEIYGGSEPPSGFKGQHCDSCPDREARDQSWCWTSSWYRDEMKRLEPELADIKSLL
ncbi:MAG: DUF4365 domain-containing protein [Gemmatimonadetes bacterium]|nr:DUF4365 domain-containing protein [Gemmatimonadota bacterium]